MGQRSQIYIRYKNKQGVQIIARYFGWNYGERMVSRTRGIIEWLSDNIGHFDWMLNDSNKVLTLERVCDVNFDMRNVLISSDIKKEICDQFAEEAQRDGVATYLFGQDNNDGQLLIDIDREKIKYALIPYYTEAEKVMSASAYMEWNVGKSWRTKEWLRHHEDNEDFREYTIQNIKYISNHAKLMTPQEAVEFVSCDYDGAVFGYPF